MSLFLEKRIKRLNSSIELLRIELNDIKSIGENDLEDKFVDVIEKIINEITINRNLIAKIVSKKII